MDFLSPPTRPSKEESKCQSSFAFGALLKNAMGSKFVSFFQEVVKPALQRNEQQIASTYQKINCFIDEVHAHIEKKLSRHEEEVFNIVREEMEEAHREVRQLAAELNRKIAQKNENEVMWVLSNELDYFKNEALKLFSANKQLRVENKLLAKTIRDYQIELDNCDLTLQKMKKQSMRQKYKQKEHRGVQSVRESSCIKIRGKDDVMGKRRMVTELSSIMRTEVEVERAQKEFDDSRIHIQISNASHGQFSNHSATKLLKNSPILITLEDQDKSVENVTIPNLSAHSHKTKSRHNFMHQRPIYQCFDKSTQTETLQMQKKQASVEDMNESKSGYDLDLFRNGFRMNATQIKTKRKQIPLRNSVDYDKSSGGSHIRSMNSSFLRGRLVELGSGKKKGSLLRMAAK